MWHAIPLSPAISTVRDDQMEGLKYHGTKSPPAVERISQSSVNVEILGWNWTTESGQKITAFTISDINNDGKDEILIGLGYLTSEMKSINGSLVVLNGTDGTILWSKFFPNSTVMDIEVGNLVDSGGLEIVVAVGDNSLGFGDPNRHTSRGVFAFNSDGSKLWFLNTTGDFYGTSDTTITVMTIGIGDLDNNGLDDVVAGLANETIIRINGSSGDVLWSIGPATATPMDELLSDCLVFDVNNDGASEIVSIFTNTSVFHESIAVGETLNATPYGWISLLNGSDGSEIWKTNIGPYDVNYRRYLMHKGQTLLIGNFMNQSNTIAVVTFSSFYNNSEDIIFNSTIKIVNASGYVLASRLFESLLPMSLAKGDLNHDGIEDIVAASVLFGEESYNELVAIDGHDFTDMWVDNKTAFATLVFVADFFPTIPGLEILHFGFPSGFTMTSHANILAENGTLIWSNDVGPMGITVTGGIGDFNGDNQIDFTFAPESLFQPGQAVTLYALMSYLRYIPPYELDNPRPMLGENVSVMITLDNTFDTHNVTLEVEVYNSSFTFNDGMPSTELRNKIDTVYITLQNGTVGTLEWTINTSQLGTGVYYLVFKPTNIQMSVLVTLPIQDPYNKTSTTDTQQAINNALRWLRNMQYSDGSWNSAAVTGLAVLAFVNNGTVDDTVKNAVDWLLNHAYSNGSIFGENFKPYQIYETSMALLGLIAYNRTLATYNATILNTIAKAVDFIVMYQNDEDWNYTIEDRDYGGWGYPGQEGNMTEQHADLSNTQWALMALWAAGLPLDNETWEKAEIFVRRCLNNQTLNPTYSAYNDGGFTYEPYGISHGASAPSYGSMTGAGIWSLILINTSYRTDPAIYSALNWLNSNFAVDKNPHVIEWGGGLMGGPATFLYYYYLTLGKAISMLGDPTYDTFYFQMRDAILSDIHVNSSDTWFWNNSLCGEFAVYATVQAVLFLQIKANATAGLLANLTLILHSAADLHVYDPLGRHIGINYTTGEIDLVPGASYTRSESGEQIITIINPLKGDYQVVLIGRAEGTASLTIVGTNAHGAEIINKSTPEIQVQPDKVYNMDMDVVTLVGEDVIYTEYRTQETYIVVSEPTVIYNKDTQTIDIVGIVAECSNILHGELNATEAVIHKYIIQMIDGTNTSITGDLTFNGSYWNAYNVSVASLPEGTYRVLIIFNDTDSPQATALSNEFSITHFITITDPVIHFDNRTMMLNITGITAVCSYTSHGTLTPDVATKYTYTILTADGTSTGITGNLEWNGTHWNVYNINVSGLTEERYYSIKITFEDPDAEASLVVENAFYIPSIEQPPPPPYPIWIVALIVGAVIIAIVVVILKKRR